MLNLPPVAQTIVFAILIIGYAVTFIFQRNKISVLISTVNALKALTEGQKSHIETYKDMVDLKTIKEVFDLQKEELIKNAITQRHSHMEEQIIQPIADQLMEFYAFIAFFFFSKTRNFEGRFTDEGRNEIIQLYFPLNRERFENAFALAKKVLDARKDRTQ